MTTLNASLMLDKAGSLLVQVAMLAALPTALIATLVQAF